MGIPILSERSLPLARSLRAALLGCVLGSVGVLLYSFAGPVSTASAQYENAVAVPESLKVGFDSFTPSLAKEWVDILAGETFEGRGTGQTGYIRAAHWVAGKAAELGLEPIGDGGTYFQMLPMERLILDPQQSKVVGPGNLVIPFERNVGLDRFAHVAEYAGKVSFVRIAGDAPQLHDQGLRGRVVIYTTDESNAKSASQLLGRQRPAMILKLVDTPPVSSFQLKRPPRGFFVHSGAISRSAATLIANASGNSVAIDRLTSATSDGAPKTFVLNTQADMSIQIRIREEPVAVPNVLARLPGADASVNDEYVVLGAHLDHLGHQGDTWYPGADDNASGSAALLGIARAMSLNPVKPKRSVLFSWFAAEEIGLVGSAHYCDHPVLPLDKMSCMFNLDMVGRNEEKDGELAEENIKSLHLVGSQKGHPKLHDLIVEANRYVGLDFEYDEEGVFLRSDQASFFKHGVSVAFLFGGFHPDYHQPSDKPDRINHEKVAAAAKLFYLSAHFAAEEDLLRVPSEESSEDSSEKTSQESSDKASEGVSGDSSAKIRVPKELVRQGSR